MPLQINPSPAYLRVLREDLRRFTTTLLTRLEQIEEAKAELYEHHLALVELLRITSHLSAVVQALLYSIEEPNPPPTP